MSEADFRKFFEMIMRALRRLQRQVQRLRKRATREAVYTVKEAAERLKKSAWYIRRMCSMGELAATRIGTDGLAGVRGEWRITNEEIERYRKEGKRRRPK